MRPMNRVLGIDIGSVSVAVALVEESGRIVATEYLFHKGNVADALIAALEQMPKLSFDLAVTTVENSGIEYAVVVDGVLSVIQAASSLCPVRRSVFVIGGERFLLIRFHQDGTYRDTRSNTSCAAGTGSFLDQQAHRLGLVSAEEMARVAMSNEGPLPKIASRCSVFAKTDLIHAQQEGYTHSQICDGLAAGVARNVVDTVVGVSKVPTPAYVVGGVARNPAVIRHLSTLAGCEVEVPPHAEVFGAVGAAMLGLEQLARRQLESSCSKMPDDLIQHLKRPPGERAYCHEPLLAAGSDGETSASNESREEGGALNGPPPTTYRFVGEKAKEENPVETEVFAENLSKGTLDVYMGVDIGSTSTKALLIQGDGTVVAGFYTRTAGRPIEAAQGLLEAVCDLEQRRGIVFNVLAVATTGSGRKLVGAVLGADLVLDEITAHARAAIEIDSSADTVIEIGGQDAKFTTLRRGIVTFSHMNTVCAAGTGSFIEEQAAKLGVGLTDIAKIARAARSPRTSDRCTVFMERDINHLLSRGYAVSEILAAVMHSVVENYLYKVATQGLIGDRICFQGATARNAALVDAFQKKLGKPVLVSRYCHLAGALGSALTVREERKSRNTGFKGKDVWREHIAVRNEVCQLCANSCKLRIASVGGQSVAFGFLCGRDYGASGPAPASSARAHDAVELRRKRYSKEMKASPPVIDKTRDITIGIPFSLYLTDDHEMWRRFFEELGARVIVSGPNAGRDGRRFAGAEYCAPVADLHGHVSHLLERADFVFLPHMLRNETREVPPDCMGHPCGEMCYYTQYAPTIIKAAFEDADRLISPLVGGPGGNKATRRELVRLLEHLLDAEPREIQDAYDRALRFDLGVRRSLAESFMTRPPPDDVEVVLAGRPYTLLSTRMNKRIPRLFASMGVPVSLQDQIPAHELDRVEAASIEELCDVPWSYASRVLAIARYAVARRGLYPVLVTAFRCSPDAFVIDAFREILDAAQKPYLILQVDDLDSAVGYETRIEAGVRAFRNHLKQADPNIAAQRARRLLGQASETEAREQPFKDLDWQAATSAILEPVKSLWGQLHNLREKTFLIPCWDRFVCELLVEMFRSRGVDARLLRETDELIASAMRHNSGQCIPVNAVAEECIDYVRREGLEPAKTALWMARSRWACNIPMYPSFLRRILKTEGLGELEVYRGGVTFSDIDPRAPVDAYFAYLFGGLLRRFGCMIRPYEEVTGSTDEAVEECLELFRGVFKEGTAKDGALKKATEILDRVKRRAVPRPKVAIFGDFYVRDNEVFNQDLIRAIEKAGGEVVTTPFSEYAKIISSAYFKRLSIQGNLGEMAKLKTLLTVMATLERRYRRNLGAEFSEPKTLSAGKSLEEELASFGMRIEQSGEAFENILKVLHLQRCHPDLGLFVQVNPAFCCPALITEALSEKIERIAGIPVVSITYDGTSASRNNVVQPYLRHAVNQMALKLAG